MSALLRYRSHQSSFHIECSPNMASNWTQSAQWIWLPGYHEKENHPGRYFLFRKSFQWSATLNIDSLPVHVSADSRYRLFINGQRLSFGPCKSYMERWHYETVDLLPYLVEGENVLSARVLRYSCITAGSSSIFSTELPGFLSHCELEVSFIMIPGRYETNLINEQIESFTVYRYNMEMFRRDNSTNHPSF